MSKITYRQARNITHVPAIDGVREDVHYVTVRTRYKDDTISKELKRITNYERPVYVTKPRYQNHLQKKETEDLDKVRKITTTQSNMKNAVARALQKTYAKASLRMLSDSPYLYESDVPSTLLIRNELSDQYGDVVDPYEVAFGDTETDVLDRGLGVIIESTCVDNTVFISVREEAMDGKPELLKRLKALADIHLKDHFDKKLKIEWSIEDNEKDVITKPLRFVDSHTVDVLSWWNIDYDVPYIIERCKVNGWRVEDIFSDPRVTPADRLFKYYGGSGSRLGNSLPPQMQWHKVFSTNSYWWADGMCVFYEIRSQEAKRSTGYGLDAVGTEILGEGKLYAVDIPIGLTTLQRHQWFQKNHPLEYVIYNIFDTYIMKLIDDETQDLSLKVPLSMGNIDLNDFKTRTRQTDLNFYQHNRDKGVVTGTLPFKKEDNPVLSRDSWIITAPAFLVKDNGLKLYIPFSDWQGNLRIYCLDMDLTSSYPSIIRALNLSKATTVTELIDIINANGFDYRIENINMVAGPVNDAVYCTRAYQLPTHKEITDLFETFLEEEGS